MWDKRSPVENLLPCCGWCWLARRLVKMMLIRLIIMSYCYCRHGSNDDWWFLLIQKGTSAAQLCRIPVSVFRSEFPRSQIKSTHTHTHAAHSRPLKHFSKDKPGWWHRQSMRIQYRWTCSAQYPVLPWQQCKAFRQVGRVRRKSCDSAAVCASVRAMCLWGVLDVFWRWTLSLSSSLSFSLNATVTTPWLCMPR